jgi:hypothetical protein
VTYADFALALHPAWLRGAWSRAWTSVIGDTLDALGTRSDPSALSLVCA